VTGDGATLYAFDALRSDGATERGSLSAASVDDARNALSRRGLLPVRVELAQTRQERRAALPVADLALGLRILANLLKAGLPVNKALQTFEELAPATWKTAIPSIQESIRQGRGLSAAMADAPSDIPPLVVGIIRAGEAGSGVAEAVGRAAAIAEHGAATRSAVRSALAYPAVVALAGVLSIGIMVVVVLPRFGTILADLGQALPPSTRIVLGVAAFARAAFVPSIVVAIAGAVALRAWAVTEKGRLRLHEILLRVPLIGTVRFASATASSTASLGALLESGVPARAALAVAGRAAGDAEIERRFGCASARIASGHSIALSFREFNAVTTTAVRLIRAGEESGQLAGMLAHAAQLEQDRAERITKTAVRFLEPMLILTFAGMVGLVAAALLQAVYSVRPG
jgi:general secretion pathway protein F